MSKEKEYKSHSDRLAAEQYYQGVLKKRDSKNVARDEKPFAAQLHHEGRKAYFEEYFNNVALEDQILPKIGPYENIIETYHFMEGYKKGPFLVEIGAIPEEYQKHKRR